VRSEFTNLLLEDAIRSFRRNHRTDSERGPFLQLTAADNRSTLRRIANDVGLERFYPHPLRHWAATSLMRNHANLESVRRILGPADLLCRSSDNREARRRFRLELRDYFELTGNPLWRTVGSAGYAALRQAIKDGRVLDNELI
jgi:integrase